MCVLTWNVKCIFFFIVDRGKKETNNNNTRKHEEMDESDMDLNGNGKSAFYWLSLRCQALC